jgi:capsular polysaccharide transport system permease protein
LAIAQADADTRQMMLSQSLQSMETARIEANRQARYISLSVAPVAPDEATYPRAFENTMVAMMIFAGIYLILSMTAAILREQVSA